MRGRRVADVPFNASDPVQACRGRDEALQRRRHHFDEISISSSVGQRPPGTEIISQFLPQRLCQAAVRHKIIQLVHGVVELCLFPIQCGKQSTHRPYDVGPRHRADGHRNNGSCSLQHILWVRNITVADRGNSLQRPIEANRVQLVPRLSCTVMPTFIIPGFLQNETGRGNDTSMRTRKIQNVVWS